VTLLAIESATDMVGVGLIRSDGAEAERIHEGGRAHAELLVPAIEEVCAVSGCTIREVEQLAVDRGPGLFTGLRVGVATAKALAQALGIGVFGVSSLDILAFAAAERFGSEDQAVVVPVVDARRGEVFTASYRFDHSASGTGGGKPVDPASVRADRHDPIDPEALAGWLAELGEETGRVVVVGDGAVRYGDLLVVHPTLDLHWAEELSAPPPLAMARLALARLAAGEPPMSATSLLPDYRRPADARINWEQRIPSTPKSGETR
jgi:tRNA threonylcarbamoyladenosine biosynthesis protein TsaB